MTFRDDSDALRAKIDSLQSRLGEAQAKLTEAGPRLAEVDRLERELAETKAELAKLTRPKPRPNRAVPAIAGILVALLLAGGMVGYLFFSAQEKQDGVWVAQQAAARDQAEAEAEAARVEAMEAAEAARLEAQRRQAELEAEPFVVRRGRVVEVQGAAPATVDAECTVRVERPGNARYDARVRVDCGGRRIYGRERSGLVECHMREQMPERCEDRGGTEANGDPMLTLDLPTDVAVVADGPELPWTVSIALTPDA